MNIYSSDRDVTVKNLQVSAVYSALDKNDLNRGVSPGMNGELSY